MNAAPLLDLMERPSYPDGVPSDVCDLFEKIAGEVRASGYERFSADAILHRIRWIYQIDRKTSAWKINNNWGPTLARWLMRKDRRFAGFFETRQARGVE